MRNPISSFLSFAFLVSGVILVGCEGSPVPLGPSDAVPVDLALVGQWDLEPGSVGEDGHGDRIHVFAFNETEFYVEYVEAKDSEVLWGDTLRTRVFVTDLPDNRIANIQCIACDDDRSFFFMEFTVEGDRLSLRSFEEDVYDAFTDLTSPDEARAVVAERISYPDFFDGETAVFVRKRQE